MSLNVAGNIIRQKSNKNMWAAVGWRISGRLLIGTVMSYHNLVLLNFRRLHKIAKSDY